VTLRTPRFARAFQLAAALSIGASLGFSSEARALSPYLEIPDQAEAMKTPSYRYANMTNDEAFAELDKRGILYTREKPIAGVRAPIRLTGRLHGVLIRSALPPIQRASGTVEVMDARLALSLDDFSAILEEHGVDEVIHFSLYRPNVAKPDANSQGGAEKEPATKKGHRRPAHAAKIRSAAAQPAQKDKAEPAKLKGAKPTKDKAIVPGGTHKKSFGEEAPSKGLAGFDSPDESEARAAFDLSDLPSEAGAKTVRGAKPRSATRSTSRIRTKATSHESGKHAVTKGSAGTESETTSDVDDDKPAAKWAPPGTRHPAGLAIDVGVLKKKDGTQLSVGADFDGQIGDKTCGAGAPEPTRANAKELRSIVCEAHDKGIFTYTLTPNFNEAHRDHFHMEIKAGVYWFLYQ
jgi:hypothetical protein